MIFADRGTRVRWLHSRIGSDDPGWAGPGIGIITDFESARRGFGPDFGTGSPGPAFQIKLDHNGLSEWVGPDQIEALPELVPAVTNEEHRADA